MVAAVATALREEHGVRPGDRVALCGANSIEWIVGLWATVSLGAVAVGMNSMWSAGELADGVELTSPKVLFVDRPRSALVGETSARVVGLEPDTDREDDLRAMAARPRGAALPRAAVDEDDAAVIRFTKIGRAACREKVWQ